MTKFRKEVTADCFNYYFSSKVSESFRSYRPEMLCKKTPVPEFLF